MVAVAGLGGGALLGCLFAMDNAEDSYWAFIAEVLIITVYSLFTCCVVTQCDLGVCLIVTQCAAGTRCGDAWRRARGNHWSGDASAQVSSHVQVPIQTHH